MTRAARLAAYLRWASVQPFVPGQWDCLIGLVGEWMRRERGGDPVAPWRGRYTTALGCARLVRREGGLEAILARGASLAGMQPTARPRPGDVSIVRPEGGDALGGIHTGAAWAVLAPRGLSLIAASATVVWRV